MAQAFPLAAGVRARLGAPTLRALLGLAAFVALFEGTALVLHDVVMRDPSPARLIRAGMWMAANVALHAGVWAGLTLALERVTSSDRALRVAFVVWLALTALARWRLDGDLLGAKLLVPLAVLVLALPRPPRRFLGSRGHRVAMAALAATWVAAVGLRGWVPEILGPEALRLYVASIAVAAGVALLALHWPRALAAVALASLLVSAGLERAAPRPEGPNVLLLLVDTLRRDHLAPYSDLVSTPALARLASEGVRFDDAVTVVPKTPAAVASLFTGRYPVHHGVRTLFQPLPEAEETLAERFAARGYRTAAYVDNPWIVRGRGFEQGFARFHGYYEIERPYGPLRHASWVRVVDQLGPRRVRPYAGVVRARALTDAVLAELQEVDAAPFFLYVHYFAPHWPYLPPAELLGRYGAGDPAASVVNDPERFGVDRGEMIFANSLPESENDLARRLYRAEVDHTLSEVGRLIDGLDALGLRDSTIVVFTADHGHSLGEHAYHYHHGSFLYEPELRIPLVMRWPARLPAGAVVRDQVGSIDTAPTLLELAGLEPHDGLDGASLAPLWQAGERPTRALLLESDVKMFRANRRREVEGVAGKLRGLRDGRHKLLLVPTADGVRWQLFDLARDPGELDDLAANGAAPERLDALRRDLLALLPDAERDALEQGAEAAGAPAGPDERERALLRELGYVE